MSSSDTTTEKEYFVAVGYSDVVAIVEVALHGIVNFQMRQTSSGTQEYKLNYRPLSDIVWNCGKLSVSEPKRFPDWLIQRLGKSSFSETPGIGWTRIVSDSEGCTSQDAVMQHNLAIKSVVAKFNRQLVVGKEGDSSRSGKQLEDLMRHSSIAVTAASTTMVEDPSWKEEWPQIPSHPLLKRRSRVRELWRKGYTRIKIAGAVEESEHVVKKDLEWLRARSLMPRKRP